MATAQASPKMKRNGKPVMVADQTSKENSHMVTLSRSISRSVDNPKGGDKIKRTATVQYPAVISRNEDGTLSHEPSMESLLNFASEVAKIQGIQGDNAAFVVLADLIQDGIDAIVDYSVRNELGKGDVVTKQIAKAVKNLKAIPGFDAMPEDALRAIIMQSPEVKAATENVNIADKVEMNLDLSALFTDRRKKKDEESKGDSTDTDSTE